jgi:glycosyltransferase involved in cell wall biosynthesis
MTTWHIITGEYPPAPGGVADYSQAVAGGLAAAGDRVHVWCPEGGGTEDRTARHDSSIMVHAIAGSWSGPDLDRIDAALDAIPVEKRLLLQWVPHAFGRRSLNLAFCRRMRRRARGGDVLDLMVHEPGLGFREGSLKHDAAAAAHRLMLITLLSEARRVWVAIPAWAERLRPWTLGRVDVPFCWLPVPSTIPVAQLNGAVSRLKADALVRQDGIVLGHFGTYSRELRCVLEAVLPGLLASLPELQVHLLGRGSEPFGEELRATAGVAGERVHASGELTPETLSCHLQACDVLLQPYPDGASSRRTTLMAALAHGLPVVTTIGRLSETFWSESDAVVAVPADDFDAMARAVFDVVKAPERRAELTAAARRAYETRFSLAHVIDALRTDACGVC